MTSPTEQPVRTVADSPETWLSVSEAVSHCSLLGLSRTPKTVRRWAQRSAKDPECGDLIVRSQDLETGFRWTIRRDSLERKIAQELEFESRKTTDQDRSNPDVSEHVRSDVEPFYSQETPEDMVGQGPTCLNKGDQESDLKAVNEELRDRILDLKSQVEFYEEEFRDRRQTTRALTDVIAAFRLNAETQANQSRGHASPTVPPSPREDRNTSRSTEKQSGIGISETDAATRRLNVISQSPAPADNEHGDESVI